MVNGLEHKDTSIALGSWRYGYQNTSQVWLKETAVQILYVYHHFITDEQAHTRLSSHGQPELAST